MTPRSIQNNTQENNYQRLFIVNSEKYKEQEQEIKDICDNDKRILKIIPTDKELLFTDVNNTEIDSTSTYKAVMYRFFQKMSKNNNNEELRQFINGEISTRNAFKSFEKEGIIKENSYKIFEEIDLSDYINKKSFTWYLFPALFLSEDVLKSYLNKFEKITKEEKTTILDFANKNIEEKINIITSSYDGKNIEYIKIMKTIFDEKGIKNNIGDIQKEVLDNQQTISQNYSTLLEGVTKREENKYVIRITNNYSNILPLKELKLDTENSLTLGTNDDVKILHKDGTIKEYKMGNSKSDECSIKIMQNLLPIFQENKNFNNTFQYYGDSEEDFVFISNLQNIMTKDVKNNISFQLNIMYNKYIHGYKKVDSLEKQFKKLKENSTKKITEGLRKNKELSEKISICTINICDGIKNEIINTI